MAAVAANWEHNSAVEPVEPVEPALRAAAQEVVPVAAVAAVAEIRLVGSEEGCSWCTSLVHFIRRNHEKSLVVM